MLPHALHAPSAKQTQSGTSKVNPADQCAEGGKGVPHSPHFLFSITIFYRHRLRASLCSLSTHIRLPPVFVLTIDSQPHDSGGTSYAHSRSDSTTCLDSLDLSICPELWGFNERRRIDRVRIRQRANNYVPSALQPPPKPTYPPSSLLSPLILLSSHDIHAC